MNYTSVPELDNLLIYEKITYHAECIYAVRDPSRVRLSPAVFFSLLKNGLRRRLCGPCRMKLKSSFSSFPSNFIDFCC